MGLVMVAAASGAIYAAHLTPKKPRHFDAIRAMVPMRDGVKLETVVFVPRQTHAPLPMLIKRTPYGVAEKDDDEPDQDTLRELIADGYVFVYQNIRGRFKSEGTFEIDRPLRDPGDENGTDEATDAYDTIEWLVHNVPNNNGRACLRGVSYDAWTAVLALALPHPALKCISEQASPNDMFVNDDIHHNGAFRLSVSLEYAALMETKKDEFKEFDFDRKDTYDWYLSLGSLAHVDERYVHGTLPSWEDYVAHPNRDDFWKKRATAERLPKSTVPNLNVAGWWDQEDLVGPLDIYAKLEESDSKHLNYLVVGPWNHGGWFAATGRKLGVVDFGSDTAKEFRVLQARWFAHWLHDAPLDLPEATIFETGSNRWRKLDRFPPATGITKKKLYFRAGGALSFDPPTESDADGFDSYVSDPANPVPYRPRPITTSNDEWREWLVQDQRFVEHRTDVLTWKTDVLDHDVVVLGDIMAELQASTSGTDSDFIVKLIDVYPDTKLEKDAGANVPDLRGFELIIACDVLRGRFRNGFERPEPIVPNAVTKFAIDLHPNAHAFLKGHRIMVQVQSTWFPLIDRNPQKFVDNIFKADDADFIKATQRVFRSRASASGIVLSVAND